MINMNKERETSQVKELGSGRVGVRDGDNSFISVIIPVILRVVILTYQLISIPHLRVACWHVVRIAVFSFLHNYKKMHFVMLLRDML